MYQHILIPIDGSETSFTAIQHAASIAQAYKSKITVVQVLVLDPIIAAEYMSLGESNLLIERSRAAIQKHLADAQQYFAEYGLSAETQLLEGQVVQREILKTAQNLNVDLIVIGSHGRSGFKKFLLGSVTQSLLTEATLPVLVTGQSVLT